MRIGKILQLLCTSFSSFVNRESSERTFRKSLVDVGHIVSTQYTLILFLIIRFGSHAGLAGGRRVSVILVNP